jgi:hypothetical protein
MRTSLTLLVMAGLLAAPWLACRAMGWDADLSLISGTIAPTDAQVMHAGACVAARIVEVLIAPMFALAAMFRAIGVGTGRHGWG